MAQKKVKRNSRKMTCVRFSEKEYTQISKIAKKKKMSIPKLLKLCYETVEGNPIEMPEQKLIELTIQVKRIGTNLNTALRKINTGDYHMIEEIKGSLETTCTETGIILRKIGKLF